MIFRLMSVLGLVAWLAIPAPAHARDAKLIFFTQDGTEDSPPLLQDFDLHSLWSALGQSDDGTLFVAVSNHNEQDGNVAIFRLDPGADAFTFVDDIRSVSTRAGNWLEGETQYKVHTFLPQHADGYLYFASFPSSNLTDQRGAHLYRLDPKSNEIVDVSASSPFTLTRGLEEVPDARASGGPGGVLLEGRGIKGIGLHPNQPDRLVFMSFDGRDLPGTLIDYSLSTGRMNVIGSSPSAAYVFHVDGQGDVYYLGEGTGGSQAVVRYDYATGQTQILQDKIPLDTEVGMVAPTANPDLILMLLSRSKSVLPINTKRERILRGGNSCGRNRWMLFNMTVSEDGKHVYFVSNNNSHSRVYRTPVAGGKCEEVLDVNALLGSRNLAFGGQNIWQGDSFFTPVWTHQKRDLAILKVTVR